MWPGRIIVVRVIALCFTVVACARPVFQSSPNPPATALTSTQAPRVLTVAPETRYPTEAPTSTVTPRPSATQTAAATPTQDTTPTPTPTLTALAAQLASTATQTRETGRAASTVLAAAATAIPERGVCPVDMTSGSADVRVLYSTSHQGVDIAAPAGTELIAVHDCAVLYFFVDQYGSQGVSFHCDGLSAVSQGNAEASDITQVQYGHVDLRLEDTLEFYGIRRSALFEEDGSPKRSVYEIRPTRNGVWTRGSGTHIFISDSGTEPNRPPDHFSHVHWAMLHLNRGTGEWTWLDPFRVADCHRP